jgi:hypothetical protein
MVTAASALAKEVGSARLPGIRHPAAGGIATTMSSERKLTFAAGGYLTQSTRIHDRVTTGGFDGTTDRQSIVLPDAVALFAVMRDGNLSLSLPGWLSSRD